MACYEIKYYCFRYTKIDKIYKIYTPTNLQYAFETFSDIVNV